MNHFRIIIVLVLLVQISECNELIVNTTSGCLIGREFKSRSGRNIAAFHGIPFAKPPVGVLRFQDPQPPEEWLGVREAFNFGSVCVQVVFTKAMSICKLGNEDCLYLSVYSPQLKPKKLLPVLVYLHGGPFFSGSGEIDESPEFFLDHDLVVVMPNYRVGVLGFLTLEDDIMPGNMGLKDQVFALVWIQRNIANFGGDPNQVTLLGDGAGGSCAHYHMYSAMSRGLFQRAISQTGTALSPWANIPPGVARSRAIKMARLFQCPTHSSKAIWNCLRVKNSYELVETGFTKFLDFQVDPFVTFSPINDKNASNPFLPIDPHDAEPASLPWIVGVTSITGVVRTGAFVRTPGALAEFEQNFYQAAPISLLYENTAQNPKEITKKVREYYFNDQPITMSLFKNLTDLYTDGMFIWPAVESLQKHRGLHYLYYFDYVGKQSYQDFMVGERILSGAADKDDILYIWRIKNPFEIPPPLTSQDLCMSDVMVRLLYNFASLGKPTSAGFDFDWPIWESQQQNFVSFENNGVRLNSSFLPRRMSFWSQLNIRDKLKMD